MANRFFRDDDGSLRAATGRQRRLLGRFLEADIQGGRALCDEVLAALDDVVAGRRRRWEMTGNAHSLSAGRRTSRIHAEAGRAADLLLPTCELRLALLEWRLLLGKGSSRRSR
jgi:uncharacterized protein YacL (UPF0231 family)